MLIIQEMAEFLPWFLPSQIHVIYWRKIKHLILESLESIFVK